MSDTTDAGRVRLCAASSIYRAVTMRGYFGPGRAEITYVLADGRTGTVARDTPDEAFAAFRAEIAKKESV